MGNGSNAYADLGNMLSDLRRALNEYRGESDALVTRLGEWEKEANRRYTLQEGLASRLKNLEEVWKQTEEGVLRYLRHMEEIWGTPSAQEVGARRICAEKCKGLKARTWDGRIA